MSTDGGDSLRVLRERIFELVTWFREDNERLRAAQGVLRTALAGSANELWKARINRHIERLEGGLDFLSMSSGPAELLCELEAVDLMAWLAAGASVLAPSQIVGAGDREHHLIRLSRERHPHTARQGTVLATHLRHHALVPARLHFGGASSVRVRVKPMCVGVERCEVARQRGSVAVATVSFGDDADIRWDNDGLAVTVPTAQQRAENLSAAIAEAGQRGIDIFVAPELTVPPAEREQVIAELRWAEAPIALLVPGSFHERVHERGANPFNRALLVDGKGNALCEHLKLVQFGELEAWLEAIHLGDEITVLVTPIGTVAIAICKDFCDDHAGQIWQQLHCEWLLVPAYGRGSAAHERAAQQISRMAGTITVLAHEGDSKLNAPQSSFVHDADALAKGNANAPSFFSHKVLLSK